MISNADRKKKSDCFHFVAHYFTDYSEQERKEYSVMYKKIPAIADKEVRIKK